MLIQTSQASYFPKDKDANDLGLRKSLHLIYNTKYMNYQELIQLKHELT